MKQTIRINGGEDFEVDNNEQCSECKGEGEILQNDGSASMGTLIPCEPCNGTGEKQGI